MVGQLDSKTSLKFSFSSLLLWNVIVMSVFFGDIERVLLEITKSSVAKQPRLEHQY